MRTPRPSTAVAAAGLLENFYTATFSKLGELLRFRHFKRYYFELEYDWDRLEFLLKMVDDVTPRLRAECETFRTFVAVLAEELGE